MEKNMKKDARNGQQTNTKHGTAAHVWLIRGAHDITDRWMHEPNQFFLSSNSLFFRLNNRNFPTISLSHLCRILISRSLCIVIVCGCVLIALRQSRHVCVFHFLVSSAVQRNRKVFSVGVNWVCAFVYETRFSPNYYLHEMTVFIVFWPYVSLRIRIFLPFLESKR